MQTAAYPSHMTAHSPVKPSAVAPGPTNGNGRALRDLPNTPSRPMEPTGYEAQGIAGGGSPAYKNQASPAARLGISPSNKAGSGRFASIRSASSGGSAGGGTVRMGAAKQRTDLSRVPPAQPQFAPQQHQRYRSDSAADESARHGYNQHSTDNAYDAARRGHLRAGTEVGPGYSGSDQHAASRHYDDQSTALASYEAAARAGGRFSDDDDDEVLEQERARFEQMQLGNGQVPGVKEADLGRADSPPGTGAHSVQLSAMDAVLLPVLDQLSLAVAQRPDAQRTIEDLRNALAHAEQVTPGLINAFAVEVYHGMAEAQADVEGIDYDEEDELAHEDRAIGAVPQGGYAGEGWQGRV